MKRFVSILSVFVLLSACNHELEKPSGLIPEDDMKEIVKEIYLYKQVRNYRLAPSLPSAADTNLAILDKHGYTLQQFKDSYQYYLIDNAGYDEFLEDIKKDLQRELPEDSIKTDKK